MVSIQVSIREAAGQRGVEGERRPAWQSIEITDKLRQPIWKPTQEGEFLTAPGDPNRQDEGVFIYPNPAKYKKIASGKPTVAVVSCGRAEVFMRKGEDEICLIRRGSPIQAAPGVMVIPDEGLGFEKEALIIFEELGTPADIFLRVDSKFTVEARIECQEK